MTEPYVIAVDLDGTLLQTDHTLSPFTIYTLKTLKKMGHHIIITTGRNYPISQCYYEQLDLNSPMITDNGARCQHPRIKNWVGERSHTISLETARQLITLQHNLNIGWINVDCGETIYVTTLDLPQSPYLRIPKNPHVLLNDTTILPERPHSFGWFSNESEQTLIKKTVKNTLDTPLDIKTWGGSLPCLDFSPIGVNKASALSHVLKHLHSNPEQLIAFGDEFNDIEMLSLAKYGIAMHNAIPATKAVASHVLPYTNDQDGVARYLTSFFNLKG